jgi:hypothetical protein
VRTHFFLFLFVLWETIPNTKCIMQIIDARIYDMRAKVPNDKRLFGYVYLENTDMSARFQFTQIDQAELSTAEELHRRTVGFTYVQHQMVLHI